MSDEPCSLVGETLTCFLLVPIALGCMAREALLVVSIITEGCFQLTVNVYIRTVLTTIARKFAQNATRILIAWGFKLANIVTSC